MGRYDFVSPGAEGFGALQRELMQRAIAERQRQEDEFKRQQAEEQSQRQAAQLALQQQQEARIAQAQQQAQTDAERQREFQRASTIATTRAPGVVDPGTLDFVRAQGFDLPVTQGQPTQGAYRGDDEASIPQYDVIPGVLQTSGGTNWQAARAAESARADQAKEAQAAAAERAREANDTRAAIAASANQGRAETTGLRNDLLRTQIDAADQRRVDADQKRADKAAADKRAKDAAKVTSGATIDVLKQLADFDANGIATLKPGTANLFGMRNPLAQLVPGSDTATATAAMDRLKGRVIVDLLNEMKNQSRTGATGFGALSGPELTLLENAASQLNSPNISDRRAADELSRIYQLANQLYGGSATEATDTTTPKRKYYDAKGNPVSR